MRLPMLRAIVSSLVLVGLLPGCEMTSESFRSDLAGDWTALVGTWIWRSTDGQAETKSFAQERTGASGDRRVMVSFFEDGTLDWTKMYMALSCSGAEGLRFKGDRFTVKDREGVPRGYVEVSDSHYTAGSTRVALRFFGEAQQIAEAIAFYATIRQDGTVDYRHVKRTADQSIEVTATLERVAPVKR